MEKFDLFVDIPTSNPIHVSHTYPRLHPAQNPCFLRNSSWALITSLNHIPAPCQSTRAAQPKPASHPAIHPPQLPAHIYRRQKIFSPASFSSSLRQCWTKWRTKSSSSRAALTRISVPRSPVGRFLRWKLSNCLALALSGAAVSNGYAQLLIRLQTRH
jgi:hypothetical protein